MWDIESPARKIWTSTAISMYCSDSLAVYVQTWVG